MVPELLIEGWYYSLWATLQVAVETQPAGLQPQMLGFVRPGIGVAYNLMALALLN